MGILKVVLLAVALLSIALLGMAVRILFVKDGKFSSSHIGGNKFLKRNGIYCAQTQDKLAQREVKKENKYKKLSFLQDN